MPRNPTAETFEATNEQYHARAEDSHSTIDDFRDDPAEYKAVYIDRTQPRAAPTEAMKFGTLVHTWVLERSSVVLIPPEFLSKSGTRHGGDYKEWAKAHPGKTLLTEAEAEPLRKMESALLDHPKARAILFEEGPRETNVRWQDHETLLWLRCRIDRPHLHLLGDLKTAKAVQPRAFASACEFFGYHRQAGHYQDGWEAKTDIVLPFVFIAITNTEPHSVLVYEMDDDFVQIGRRENRSALRYLAECRASGVFKPKGWDRILTIKAPPSAAYRDQWEVA